MTPRSARPWLGLGLSLLALMGGCGAAGTPPPDPALALGACADPVAVRSLGSGLLSGLMDERITLVRDQPAWAALWAQHAPGRPAPSVDFATEQVLVVLRQHPTGGYALEVVEACREGDSLTVRVVEHAPGPDEATVQILTQPWAFVALPRLTGRVTVRLAIRVGSPPGAAP
ncbi:MAG: protease complex subunit PrcB family protein [Candidatus Sericytochromatia bacterium]|nr:protease complex subunit PrcB family protein [Candidatus Sericytochromatia bacterium]